MKYPEDFINKVICGDCLEVMKDIPDKSVDLVVTSPPYDNLRNYGGYSFNFKRIAQELFRVIIEGGIVVWVVGDAVINGSETGTSFRQALYFKDIGFNIHDTMIYAKTGMSFPSNNRYNQIFEYMFIFSKNIPKKTNLLKDKLNRWRGESNFGTMSKRQINGTLKQKGKIIVSDYGIRWNTAKIETCGI